MNARENTASSLTQGAVAPWAQLPMALAMRNMSAMLRAAEAISNVQLNATRATRALHEHAEDQVETTGDGLDLNAVQSDLLQREAMEVAHYWQNLFEVFVRLQTDLFSALQPAIDSQVEAPEQVEPQTPITTWWKGTPFEAWFQALNGSAEMATAVPEAITVTRTANQAPAKRRSTKARRSRV